MPWFTLNFYISLSYCLPSLALYTLLIIMLIRNWKDFNSAFFKLIIADYLFNLLTYLNSLLTLRLPNGTCKNCLLSAFFLGIGRKVPKFNEFWNVVYFLYFGNAYFQYSMVTLMSLNRVTSIFFLLDNEKIWSFLLPIFLFLIILITIFCSRTILITNPFYQYSEATDMFNFICEPDILPAYNNVLNFMAVSVCLTIFLNLISVIKLKMSHHQISVAERNLLVITIFSAGVQGFAAGNTFILQTGFSAYSIWVDIAMAVLPFSSDFLTIGQPYILLLFSSKVRKAFAKMFWNPKIGMMSGSGGPGSFTRSANVLSN